MFHSFLPLLLCWIVEPVWTEGLFTELGVGNTEATQRLHEIPHLSSQQPAYRYLTGAELHSQKVLQYLTVPNNTSVPTGQ